MLKTVDWELLSSIFAVPGAPPFSPEGQWTSRGPTRNPYTGIVLTEWCVYTERSRSRRRGNEPLSSIQCWKFLDRMNW